MLSSALSFCMQFIFFLPPNLYEAGFEILPLSLFDCGREHMRAELIKESTLALQSQESKMKQQVLLFLIQNLSFPTSIPYITL